MCAKVFQLLERDYQLGSAHLLQHRYHRSTFEAELGTVVSKLDNTSQYDLIFVKIHLTQAPNKGDKLANSIHFVK